MTVAAVVLSWNRRDDTLACLRSLSAVTEPELLTILVDNGSEDGTEEAVRAEFPAVAVVQTGANLGYAAGNNAGLRLALERGASHVLVLNNDVEVEPGAIGALVAEAGRRPDAGALCSKILFAEPPDLIWFAGATFDPRSGYNGRQRGYREHDGPRFEAVTETDRACGAAMLVPRAVLEQVGLFDAELFLYAEDTDWSLRARAAGFRHYVVPASRVRHKVSASSGGESSPAALYYDLRNTIVVCERYAPLGRIGTARRRFVLVASHAAQALLAGRRREALSATWAGWRDARAGRLGRKLGT